VTHVTYADWLGNLASSLSERFKWRGSTDDVERAIVLNRQALRSLPSQHPARCTFLNNMSAALTYQFNRKENLCDIEEAITASQEAVRNTSPDHPKLSGYL